MRFVSDWLCIRYVLSPTFCRWNVLSPIRFVADTFCRQYVLSWYVLSIYRLPTSFFLFTCTLDGCQISICLFTRLMTAYLPPVWFLHYCMMSAQVCGVWCLLNRLTVWCTPTCVMSPRLYMWRLPTLYDSCYYVEYYRNIQYIWKFIASFLLCAKCGSIQFVTLFCYQINQEYFSAGF